MTQQTKLELKAERHELIKLMCVPFRRQPDFQQTKANFTRFINRMGNQNVLDCLAAMKD